MVASPSPTALRASSVPAFLLPRFLANSCSLSVWQDPHRHLQSPRLLRRQLFGRVTIHDFHSTPEYIVADRSSRDPMVFSSCICRRVTPSPPLIGFVLGTV